VAGSQNHSKDKLPGFRQELDSLFGIGRYERFDATNARSLNNSFKPSHGWQLSSPIKN
jgi:hypothetical protein